MAYEVLDSSELVQFNEWSFQTQTQQPLLARLHFQTIKYSNNSIYLYIGDSSSKLENMSCSMKTAYSSEPLNTYLLFGNNESSQLSNDLALKLAKRLNKQVFVSVNVAFATIYDADSQDSFLKTVELALFKEIKQNPDKF